MRRNFYFRLFCLSFLVVFNSHLSFSQCTVAIAPSSASICNGSSVQLIASGASTYTWSPSAGLSCTNCSNPSALPFSTTTYTVIGYNPAPCDTVTITVTVNPLPNTPTILVNPSTPQCAGTLISFSVTNVQVGVTYSWDFGDGNTGSGVNTSHLYSSTGNGTISYTVTVTATFISTGCTKSNTTTVQVKQAPDPTLIDYHYPAFTNCNGGSFTDTVNNGSSTASTNTNYLIVWGDGSPNYSSTTFSSEVTHIYVTLGYFNLIFTVTGQDGCIASHTYQVYNGSNPAGGIISPGGTIGLCPPATINFPISDTALSNPPGTIYIFTSNDGSVSDTFQQPPPPFYTHIFTHSSCGASGGTTPNTFYIKLKIENPCGVTYSTIEPITVNSPPVADFTISPDTIVCINTDVTFTNTMTDAVYVDNNGNCISTTKFNWVITPSTGWTIVSGALGLDPPTSNPSTWGTSPLVLNFNIPGIYTMQLQTASTLNSCGESIKTRTICVNPNPISIFSLSPASGCSPLSTTANNTSPLPYCGQNTYTWTVIYSGSSCPPNTSNWQFTGGTNANSTNPSFQFINAGTYTVSLSVDNLGCSPASSSTTVSVKTVPVVTLNSIPSICAGQSISPTATVYNCYATTGPTYSWSFPGGSPSTSTAAIPGAIAYATGGIYTITLTVSNECGSTTVTQNVTVIALPIANAGPDVTICSGLSATLTASGGITYLWNNGATTASITVTPAGTTTYTVTVSNGSGCSATDAVQVTVIPTPTANAGPDVSICPGASATLTATGGVTYLWSTGATTASTTVTPPGTTTYTVTVTAANGCTASDVVVVSIYPLPVANAGPDISICIGQSTTLTATGGGSYLWNTGATTASITVSPTVTTSYTVTVTSGVGCTASDQVQVTVLALPIANAGLDVTICSGQSATLTASGGSTYLWNNGATTASITVTPAGTTTYTVTVSNGSGCSATDAVQVIVIPSPTANAGPDVSICPGASTTLTATGGVTYLWSTGQTTATITVTPPVTTTYTVTVTAANGCTASDAVVVSIYPLPVANAGPDVSICIQESTTLTATGGGTYLWNTGATTASITVSPSVTTTYTVTVTSGVGCTASDQVQVTVLSLPIANAGPDVTICSGQSTTLTASGGSTYLWNNGATTASITVTPATTTTYTVTVSNGSGCSATDAVQVIVIPSPTANAGPDVSICPGANATLTATGGGSYLWSMGATTASTTVTPPGTTTYTVTVTAVNGCTTSDAVVVDIYPLPPANAGPDVSICIQQSTTLTATGGGTYLWNTGATTASITVSPTGTTTYTVTVTSGVGCTASDQVQVTVLALPIANAGLDVTICSGQSTTLTASGGITYLWNNGATTASITVTPGSTTTYTVTVSNGSGCSATDAVQVIVNPSPTASVNSPAICIGETATITAVGGGTYLWNTGETTSFITVSPANTTTYTVTVTNSFSCTSSATSTVTVNPLPIPNFGVDSIGCINLPLIFLNLTTGAASYQWNFGDGGTSSVVNPSHIYSSIGSYQVTLVATSSAGCIDSISDSVFITQLSPISFTTSIDSGCGPLSVSFNTVSSGYGINYHWDFGNGMTSNQLDPGTITFQSNPNTDTTYFITFTASNLCDTLLYLDSVKVIPEPTAYFGININSGCSPVQIFFSNNSFGLPTSFLWDFGDGTTSTSQVPGVHYYFTGSTDTTYYITLTATNQCGSSVWIDSVHVLPNNVSAFINANPISGCEPLTVFFTNFTVGATNYYWNFGDGNISNLFSPTHTYSDSGTFSVIMIANDGCGIDTAFTSITVYPQPVVVFSVSQDTICSGHEITFTNQSQNLSSVIWFFGDGATSTEFNPVHIYTSSGQDTVILIGAMQNTGCPDTASHIVTILPSPISQFTLSPADGCQPLNVTFINNSFNASYQIWNFGDGNSSIINTPVHVYTDSGQYTVTLITFNNIGCSDTASALMNVYPKPTASFLVSQDSSCYLPVTIELTNTSTGAYGYSWDLGNGQTSSLFNPPQVIYNALGTYQIILIVSNQYGCSDTAEFDFNVYPTPVASFDFGPFAGCEPLTVSFNNTSQYGLTYYWDFGNGDTSSQNNPTYTYTSVGLYTPSVIVTGAGGCTDTMISTTSVTVYPTPNAAFDFQGFNLAAPNAAITFTNQSTDADSYVWDFGDGTSSTETNPTHIFSKNDSFLVTLIATNSYGCSDTASEWVYVKFVFGLYVPNALTPGYGPEADQKFTPKGVGLKTYHIWIYDTWGNMLWESEKLTESGSPEESWTGYFQGQLLPQDVYVWKIQAVFQNGQVWAGKDYPKEHTKPTGTVTLLR